MSTVLWVLLIKLIGIVVLTAGVYAVFWFAFHIKKTGFEMLIVVSLAISIVFGATGNDVGVIPAVIYAFVVFKVFKIITALMFIAKKT